MNLEISFNPTVYTYDAHEKPTCPHCAAPLSAPAPITQHEPWFAECPAGHQVIMQAEDTTDDGNSHRTG